MHAAASTSVSHLDSLTILHLSLKQHDGIRPLLKTKSYDICMC